MSNHVNQIANYLLQIKAIKLEPSNPFTWASGWKSPIYCDNRKTLSYPEVRGAIKEAFIDILKEKFTNIEAIAGVATGGIAIGALVAEELGLPFVYVRSSAKSHGMTNQIEGHYNAKQRMVVIEDLISTGGSSLRAVEALKAANCSVLGMVAIFTYGFQQAVNNFKKADCTLYTLSNYDALIKQAKDINYISEEDATRLKDWRKDPANWS